MERLWEVRLLDPLVGGGDEEEVAEKASTEVVVLAESMNDIQQAVLAISSRPQRRGVLRRIVAILHDYSKDLRGFFW